MTDEVVWDGSPEFRQRRYETYEAYAEHQASKLKLIDLAKYTPAFKAALAPRIEALKPLINAGGRTVLCLAARNGAECEAWIGADFLAIGIDLNPGENNRFVVVGDFHALQFPKGVFDVVFTNSLDHAFELGKVVDEARRVLKPGGIFVAEVVRGSKDENGREPGPYEAAWWDSASVVRDEIGRHALDLVATNPFDDPWVGDQYVFRKPGGRRRDEASATPGGLWGRLRRLINPEK
jgi:SAM-dependent methyltransferase